MRGRVTKGEAAPLSSGLHQIALLYVEGSIYHTECDFLIDLL